MKVEKNNINCEAAKIKIRQFVRSKFFHLKVTPMKIEKKKTHCEAAKIEIRQFVKSKLFPLKVVHMKIEKKTIKLWPPKLKYDNLSVF